MEQHNLYLPFLDIMINKDPETNDIWMDTFYKKTDTRRCVPFNSCHPKECKNNILFTLARRICTTVGLEKYAQTNFKKFYILKNILKI